MTWGAAELGTTSTATHQLAMTVWTFLAFALDAVAIAAQTLVGGALGSGDRDLVRRLTRRMIRIGLVSGVVTGILLALAAPVLGPLFSSDPEVVADLALVLLVAAVAQPLAGVVFVLDGVLIGAGDGRYLATGGTLVALVFVPLAVLTVRVVDGSTVGLLWLWAVFGLVFIGGRTLVLVHRARGTAWMRLGA